MFKSELCCKQITDDIWELTAPLTHESAYGTFTAPAGFRTDFASVPRAPIAWWFCGGLGEAAAVVHDYLYKVGITSKDVADRVFYIALRDMGVSPFKSSIMFTAVKYGGWHMWRKYRSEEIR